VSFLKLFPALPDIHISIIKGPQLPKKIRALASYRDYTFAAYGSDIAVVKRAHQVCFFL